ncbi:transcriptional regulator [Pseudomonas alabamensis]|uniref:transcriptional regulator n=1 Tax=Pseudomonas alabamensis TaxID=3064349 RepID=UPI0016424862
MTEHLHPYDPADALDTLEALAAFLSDALDAQDTGHLIQALAVAARAKARQGDTSAAEAVAAALAEVPAHAELPLDTFRTVLRHLGLTLTVSTGEHAHGLA